MGFLPQGAPLEGAMGKPKLAMPRMRGRAQRRGTPPLGRVLTTGIDNNLFQMQPRRPMVSFGKRFYRRSGRQDASLGDFGLQFGLLPFLESSGAPSVSTLSIPIWLPACAGSVAHSDDFRAGKLQLVCDLGPAGGGNYPPEASPLTADKVRARMQLAAMISCGEGSLDSCQAGDTGIVSFGLLQWSAPDNENLTSTLDPTKSAAENERAYFPSHATFFRLAPGRARSLPGAADRRKLFLGTADDRDDGRAWCARARLAALCSDEYLRIQIHTAAWRMTWMQFKIADNVTRTRIRRSCNGCASTPILSDLPEYSAEA